MRITHIPLLSIVLAALAVGVTACSGDNDSEKVPKKKLPLIQVSPAQRTDIQVDIVMTGTVQANLQSTVSTPIDGVVASLEARENQRVTRDQVIAIVSSHERLSLIANAKSRIRELENRLETEGTVPEQRSHLLGELEQVRSDLKYARTIHKDVQVISPLDGVVTQRHVDIGSMVHAKDPLVTVSDMNSLVIKVAVHERHYQYLARGRALRFTLNAYPGDTLGGVIDVIYPNVDADTRSVNIDIKMISNRKSIIPGMLAEVRLPTVHRKSAIMIPERAVLIAPDNTTFVYIAEENGNVTRRLVVPGILDGIMIEILSGLKPDELVVVDGQERLRDGITARIMQESSKGSK